MSEKDKKDETEDNEKSDKTLTERTSLLEWIVAAIGLLVVIFSIGFVSYKAITSEDEPPDLLIKSTSTKKLPNGYLVEFKVINKGDRTAANVVIEGKLSNGETKTIAIDYVASKSEQEGGMFFTDDPQQNDLEIKAVGYENP